MSEYYRLRQIKHASFLNFPLVADQKTTSMRKNLRSQLELFSTKGLKAMRTGQLFYEWLITQRERTDPIGELARVALNHSDAKTVKNYVGDWRRYFKMKDVSPISITLVGRAWAQYRQNQPQLIDPSNKVVDTF